MDTCPNLVALEQLNNRVELLESTSLKTHRAQPAMLVQAGNLSYTDNMLCSADVIHKKQAPNFGKERVAVEKTLNITKILVEGVNKHACSVLWDSFDS